MLSDTQYMDRIQEKKKRGVARQSLKKKIEKSRKEESKTKKEERKRRNSDSGASREGFGRAWALFQLNRDTSLDLIID